MRTTPIVSRNKMRAASIAIGTALAVVAAAPMAAIVDSGAVTINIPNTFDGLYINWLTGLTATSGAALPGWDFNAYNSGVSLSFFWNNTPANTGGGLAGTTTGPYINVTPGTIISSASTFSNVTATAQTAAFQSAGSKILGFRFYNEGTSAINYGYALLTVAGATGFPLTITRYFFENTGAAITATNGSAPPVLQGVVSRMVHGAAGPFDLPLSFVPPPAVNPNPTTESRQGPGHQLVFTFNNPITGVSIAVTEGTATAGIPSLVGNTVFFVLTGVGDQQYVTVTLTNVADSAGGTGGTAAARIGFLAGDVSGSRVVTLTDVGQVNGVLAQSVTASNYLNDINTSGTLTLTDKGIANGALTRALPPP